MSNEAAASSSLNTATEVKVPGDPVFLDLGAIVQAQSSNNLVLTKVQGRDYSRKELISGGDINFTVTGKIVSNYPDVYPYAEVSKFITLMQHKGVIQVFNLMFQQFNVTQILIKDFNMGQNEGFKNVQPYSFTCVAVEPDDAVNVVQDTINGTNLEISQMKKQGWAKVLLDKVKASAANQAAQMIESLTSNTILSMKLPEAIIIDGKECLDILCCKILIWEANSDVIEINDPDENNALLFGNVKVLR